MNGIMVIYARAGNEDANEFQADQFHGFGS
jgi:hypothetical protein